MSMENLIQVIYEESGYPSEFCLGSDNERLIEAVKVAHKPFVRQQQLTLMSAGVQQFIDQLKEIPVGDFSSMTVQEFRDFIVEVGEDSIKRMNPSPYTVNKDDKV